jgi:hypothetical protein
MLNVTACYKLKDFIPKIVIWNKKNGDSDKEVIKKPESP